MGVRAPDFGRLFVAGREHDMSHLRPDWSATVRIARRAELALPSGRLVACEPWYFLSEDTRENAFVQQVAPGRYPVELVVADFADPDNPGGDPKFSEVAAARVVIRPEPVVRWGMALRAGQDEATLGENGFYGYPVDGGMGSFGSVELVAALDAAGDDELMRDEVLDFWDPDEIGEYTDEASGLNLVFFQSGGGDGFYPTWVGYTANEEVACFLTDFGTLTPDGDDEQNGDNVTDDDTTSSAPASSDDAAAAKSTGQATDGDLAAADEQPVENATSTDGSNATSTGGSVVAERNPEGAENGDDASVAASAATGSTDSLGSGATDEGTGNGSGDDGSGSGSAPNHAVAENDSDDARDSSRQPESGHGSTRDDKADSSVQEEPGSRSIPAGPGGEPFVGGLIAGATPLVPGRLTRAVPATPARPAVPSVPAVPATKTVPATPARPLIPARPASHAVRASTAVPMKPAVPKTTPAVPATPAPPATPAEPAANAAPATPAAPAIPATQAATTAAAVPGRRAEPLTPRLGSQATPLGRRVAERPAYQRRDPENFASGSEMRVGQMLHRQSLISPSGRFILVYQSDGNLVLYRYRGHDERPVWASGTDYTSVGECVLQEDGNLVVHDWEGKVVWSSDTAGQSVTRLVVHDVGVATLETDTGEPVWSTAW